MPVCSISIEELFLNKIYQHVNIGRNDENQCLQGYSSFDHIKKDLFACSESNVHIKTNKLYLLYGYTAPISCTENIHFSPKLSLMKNVLLQACRAMRGYNERQIAAKLGMKPEDYIELETGAIIMTSAQAEWLSDLYRIDRQFFLESSQQLDLLLTRAEVIKQLQTENEYQHSELERIRLFIFINKDKFLDDNREDETEEMDEIEEMDKNADHEQETSHQ